MNELIDIELAELGETITGKTPSSKNPEDFGFGYMFVTPSDNWDIKLIERTERYVSQLGIDKLSKKALPPKSVMVSCIGSAMGKILMNSQKCLTNQQINSIVVDDKKYDADYVYYLLVNNYKALRTAATGSTSLPLLNKTDFDALKLKVHREKTTQKQIAKVLSDLDAKIEVNNKINQELEALAKTIYDYWFVQFDFPDQNGKPYKSSGGKMVYNEELKREIPEGWEVKRLGDLGNFKNGVNYDPSNPGEIACPIINVRNISASSYFLKNEDLDIIYLNDSDVRKYSVHEDSIIIARSGIPGATRLIADFQENTLYCGFAIHYQLDNVDIKLPVFFYLKSIERVIKEGSGGTILKNVNQATLNGLKIALPSSNNFIESFNKRISPMFMKINLIQKENQKLAALRDWLLPMLMNGQVTVSSPEEVRDQDKEILNQVQDDNKQVQDDSLGRVAEEVEKYS